MLLFFFRFLGFFIILILFVVGFLVVGFCDVVLLFWKEGCCRAFFLACVVAYLSTDLSYFEMEQTILLLRYMRCAHISEAELMYEGRTNSKRNACKSLTNRTKIQNSQKVKKNVYIIHNVRSLGLSLSFFFKQQ